MLTAIASTSPSQNRDPKAAFRIVVLGRWRDMGPGSVDLVSLEEARDLARQYRRIA